MNGILGVNKLQSFDAWEIDRLADYTGSDRKEGLIDQSGTRYLVKYADNHTRVNNMDTSYVNNVVSEYLSSHILSILGYDVHETILGTRNGEVAVACKNFIPPNCNLIEFGVIMRKHYYSHQLDRVPTLEQIRHMFSEDSLLSPQSNEYMKSYAERLVGDALVGNFDRHKGNWGYIVSDNSVSIAPIYDNGSTLFPALSEKGMCEVLADKKEIAKRVFLFPKIALIINGCKATYWDILASDYIPEVTEAVIKMAPVIENKINDACVFIDNCEYISDIRKRFYVTMLTERFKNLINKAYHVCISNEFDKDAYNRLCNGINYDEDLFEEKYRTKLLNMCSCKQI